MAMASLSNGTARHARLDALDTSIVSPPYDAHELSSGSVLFLFAVLMCGIVSLLHFVISTVTQLSDVHSSLIYLAVLFIHKLTVIPYIHEHCNAQSAMFFVDWALEHCIVLY